MASTKSVLSTRSAWLFHLLSKFEVKDLSVDLPNALAFRFFTLYLILKTATPFIFSDGFSSSSLGQFFALAILLGLGTWQRSYFFAMGTIASIASYEIYKSWPLTINHQALELGMIIIAWMLPYERASKSTLSSTDLIKFLMLSVWFYSGLHKLFDGYFLNGEFFSLEALANDSFLGENLNHIIRFFTANHFAFSHLVCCQETTFHIADLEKIIVLVLAWGTILVEIMLPILYFTKRFRTLSIIGLFTFQLIIALSSGEIDFAFTAFAVLLLFTPRLAVWAYPSLAIVYLVVQPW